MRIRPSVIFFVAAGTVLIVLTIWLGRKPTEKPSPTVAEAETSVVPQPLTARTVTESSHPIHTNTPVARATPEATIPHAPLKTEAEQMKEGLAALNDEDVVLYGKVIDQFGAPVANAAVGGSIQVNNGTREGTDKVSVTTDASGLFTISGHKGKALGINIRKAGYVMAATNTRFVYSLLWSDAERYNPDPNNPALIKMWKLQGPEPLVAISKIYKLPFTGAALFFDLLTGNVSEIGGDLQVVITRAPGSLSKRNPGDWSVAFAPVNGGIMESDYQTAQVTFEAPTDGYQINYVVQMKRDDPAWFDNVQKEFFLTSRNGQVYSKLHVDFGINDDPSGTMWIQFKGIANPNGSRNWEGDMSTTAMKQQ